MTNDEIKYVFQTTTRQVPLFNRTEGFFDYFVDLMEKNDRWNFVHDYFTRNNYDYLKVKENIVKELQNDFVNKNAAKRLMQIKHTYPFTFINDKYYIVDGKEYVFVDLTEACYQAVKYFGIYQDDTWNSYISKFTNDDFAINYDEKLRLESLHVKDYKKNSGFTNKEFGMAYSQMLYDAYVNGLMEFMLDHGCRMEYKQSDTICFVIEDKNKFKSFENEWPGIFSDVSLHYMLSAPRYAYFSVPEYSKPQRVLITERNDGTTYVSKIGDIHYPQYRKLSLGNQVIEKDFYYLGNERASEVRIIK